ncbi:MAG: YegP family protein [Treponema sp.]|nr:YegP family protein [Treponema sp.]
MGKFVISRTKNNGFKFNLVATNGEVIATSEVYTQKPKCKVGIASVIKNCGAEVENQTVEGYAKLPRPKYEVYKDKAGEFRFRLVATNGRIIAVGEGYKAIASCLNGISSIKKNAPEAKIEDNSLLRKTPAEG